jgi:prepilin-type N-terminal cleavage/methylation domain-containing protein
MTDKKQNAFTIVELLVAMTLLVILLGLSGLVFNTSVKAFRAGTATVEMTRNLRALTQQLSADFQGLQAEAPMFIGFNFIDTDGDAIPDTHFDTIHFFANGDFQTTGQYNDGSGLKTVSGNMARIYYGHANTSGIDYDLNHILARKAHILTSDAGIFGVYGEIPAITGSPMYVPFDGSFGGPEENLREFNTITLTNWINALNYYAGADGIVGTADDAQDNADRFINFCMSDAFRPVIGITNPNTLHLLMSQGLIQMQIQWAYTYDDLNDLSGIGQGYFEGVRWWPSVEEDRLWPNINATTELLTTSDFDAMTGGVPANPFGGYFNLPNGTNTVTNWYPMQNCGTQIASTGTQMTFKDDFYPKALKFTFLVKDAKGVFNDGKTFTHIVYLDN